MEQTPPQKQRRPYEPRIVMTLDEIALMLDMTPQALRGICEAGKARPVRACNTTDNGRIVDIETLELKPENISVPRNGAETLCHDFWLCVHLKSIPDSLNPVTSIQFTDMENGTYGVANSELTKIIGGEGHNGRPLYYRPVTSHHVIRAVDDLAHKARGILLKADPRPQPLPFK